MRSSAAHPQRGPRRRRRSRRTRHPARRDRVAASRYSLAAERADVHTFLTQHEIESLPRFADDSLKAVHRLPGAATNGLSGLANIRGGECERDAGRVRRPAALRAVPPAAAAESRQPARSARAERARRACRWLHRRVRRPHERGHRGDVAAPGRRTSITSSGPACSTRMRSPRSASTGTGRSGSSRPPQQPRRGRRPRRIGDRRAELHRRLRPHRLRVLAGHAASLHVLLSSDRAEVLKSDETEFAEVDVPQFVLSGGRSSTISRRPSAARAILSYTDVAADRTAR